jgi:hypothetical protein
MISMQMRRSRSFLLLLLACALGSSGCSGSCSDAPPAPNFDPEALVGRWKTVIPEGEGAPELKIDVRYTAGRFALRMVVGGDSTAKVSGAWTIEGDDLIETPEKSDLPFWTVGVATRSKILILDPEQFIFARGDSIMRYARAGS